LLQAFAKLPAELEEKRCACIRRADEGGMRAQLEQMAAQLGVRTRMQFAGPIFGASKWAAYRDADVLCFPHRTKISETRGGGGGAGTPVIVTEQCGIAPLLADEAGLVVRHDAAALSELLRASWAQRRHVRGSRRMPHGHFTIGMGRTGPRDGNSIRKACFPASIAAESQLVGQSLPTSRHPIFRTSGGAAIFCWLLASWRCSIPAAGVFRPQYLRGFSDAIVPAGYTPEQKIDAILDWMRTGPPRAVAANLEDLSKRDPETTLNYSNSLRCVEQPRMLF